MSLWGRRTGLCDDATGSRTWGAEDAQVVTVPGVIRVALGRRWVAVAAAVAGVAISWLFAAVQQYAFDDLSGRRLPYVPDVWFGAYEAVYERLGLPLGLSQYYFWGRFAFLIYVCGLVSVISLPHGHSRLTRVGRRLLFVAFGLGLLGDVLAYWGGTGDELTTLTGVGFGLIEVPAMLLMVPAVVSYGLGLLRDRVLPRWSAWSLVCGGILALPGSLIVITYVPHGFLITMLAAIAVALIGFAIDDHRHAVARDEQVL